VEVPAGGGCPPEVSSTLTRSVPCARSQPATIAKRKILLSCKITGVRVSFPRRTLQRVLGPFSGVLGAMTGVTT